MYKNIVIPVDISDVQSIRSVLPIVLNFVNAYGAKLHFVHIVPDFGMKMIEDYLPKHWVRDQTAKCNAQIKELIDKYVPNEIKVDLYVGRGAVYDEVIQYSNKVEADLIVVSAVRPQLKDYMLGPNASKIVRHAGISVLVVRDV